MSAELRWNPLTKRFVVIAGLRESRPREQDLSAVEQDRPPFEPACPFCPGNEAETMPAVRVLGDESGPGGWQMRVVPNKFPSFDGDTPVGARATAAPSSGASEVVVFTRRHDADLADLASSELVDMLQVIIERRQQHGVQAAVEHTSVIVNRGGNSGASMTHGHAQILSTPFVPPTVRDELDGFTTVDDLVREAFDGDGEGDSDRLLVERRPTAVAGCPKWSAFSYETWIVPTSPTPDLAVTDVDVIRDVAELIGDALRRCRGVLGDCDHNVILRFAPHRYDGPFQWHAQVLPRHVALAGFEISSGVAVNPVPPELAAERLRAVQPGGAAR